MNTDYLNTLPEVKNRFNVDLTDGEKVVFTAKMPTFGTETDQLLGAKSMFTLTNMRIIADNGLGVWTADISEDVTKFIRDENKSLFFMPSCFCVTLREFILCEIGIVNGFRFYFKRKDAATLGNIVDNLNR